MSQSIRKGIKHLAMFICVLVSFNGMANSLAGSVVVPKKPVPIPKDAYVQKSDKFDLAIYTPMLLSNQIKVPQYEKFELGVKLPSELTLSVKRFIHHVYKGNKINPFDSTQLDVYAVFTHQETGVSHKVNGFYYEEFKRVMTDPNKDNWTWKEDTNSFIFRVRFAEGQLGEWVAQTFYRTKDQKVAGPSFKFQMEPSNSPGFITLPEKGGKFLKDSRDKDVFLIGENLAWTTPYTELKPYSTLQMNQWQKELSESGGNHLRVGTWPISYGFEWEKRGNYGRNPNSDGKEVNRQINAWEFDQVVSKNDELDLYMLVFLEVHNEFFDSCEVTWFHPNVSIYNNPYRDLIEREDFFENDSCKIYYKRKLRYFVSRWGYSRSLLCYEILSEIDHFFPKSDHENCEGKSTYHTSKESREKLVKWYDEMHAYLDYLTDDKAIVSGSYAIREDEKINEHIWKNSDLILGHRYSFSQDENYDAKMDFLQRFKKKSTTKNIPIILDECGPDRADIIFSSDVTFHNTIWSTSFMGSFGCGMVWWWDRGLHSNNSIKEFKGLSQFFEGEDDLNSFNFQPKVYSDISRKRRKFKRAEVEYYSLVSEEKDHALLWVHNKSYWWGNMSNEDQEVRKMVENTGEKLQIKEGFNSFEMTLNAESVNMDTGSLKVVEKPITVKHLKANSNYLYEFYHTSNGKLLDEGMIKTSICGKGIFPDKFTTLLNEDFGDVAVKLYLKEEEVTKSK